MTVPCPANPAVAASIAPIRAALLALGLAMLPACGDAAQNKGTAAAAPDRRHAGAQRPCGVRPDVRTAD